MPDVQTVRQLRRAQIIEKARAIIANRGFEAMTIGALERELDFSRGVITYHFKNKDDIVHAVLDSTLQDIDEAARNAVVASEDWDGRIRAVLVSMVTGFLERKDGGQVLLAFWGRLRADERAANVNADLYARYRRQTEKLVREGQNGGDFRADVDPRAMSTVIVGLVIGICVQAYFREGAIDVDGAVEEAVASVASRLKPEAS